MKKLIVSTVLAGALVSSIVVSGFLGCSSPDKLGEGNGNPGNGGSGGTPVIKLDGGASNPGQGGAGGKGTSSSPPTGDANCGSQTANTTREPPDVLLVLDRSSSMFYTISQDCFCSDADAAAAGTTSFQLCADTTNCQTRWSAVKPAVTDTVANAKDVNWGLKFFPTAGVAQCSVSNTMEVEIGPNNADTIKGQVDNATVSLSTPTTAALKAATTYLKSLTDNRPRFILLATDGEPNCANGQINRTDVPGAANAAKAAYDAGFPVFVVGIGPNLGNLSQLASAGGTKDYYPVSSPQDLVNAFADISKVVASCTFTLSSTPPDINNIGVYLDKNLVEKDPTNGWSLGGGNKTVILNGDSCDKVTSGKATEVQLLFGCPGQPPPLTIP
jgi:hypothetical protein